MFNVELTLFIVGGSFVIVAENNNNKENNVFKDALGVKGLGFKHHGN